LCFIKPETLFDMKHLKLFFLFLAVVKFSAFAQDTQNFLSVSGRIIDHENRRGLSFVSIRLDGTNIATVSNAAGDFLLKIPIEHANSSISLSHLGFQTQQIPIHSFGDARKIIRMIPSSIELAEVEILRGDATDFIREVFRAVPRNFPQRSYQMVGFYRETIRKNNNFISVTEAVLDIYKSPYRGLNNDQARIYKARRGADIRRNDTILIRFQGGVDAALRLDVVRNLEDIFFEDFANYYSFYFEGRTVINNRPQQIVVFDQRRGIPYPLFRGRIYVDMQSKAISQIEFNMNVEGNARATDLFVQRRPPGMRIEITEAAYLIQYTEHNGLWYYEYSRATLAFRVRWQRRLFSSSYIIQSEMAITDRTDEGVSRFSRSERLRPNAVIAERAVDFEDEDFWGAYNIIQPEQSLENAIRQLTRQLRRRE